MIFKCVNCGGQVVYDPKEHSMRCLSCHGINTEELIQQTDVYSCINCGGQIERGEYRSATICKFCGASVILEDRITDLYEPNLIVPFSLSKEDAAQVLKKEFKKGMFIPGDFLSNKTLEFLEGNYVPFWLYNYDSAIDYDAIGTKVKSWTSGSYRYTETSKYHVVRKMNIDFTRVPVDASFEMDDKTMDIMEPYNYQELIDFKPGYLSGYEAEIYNFTSEQIEDRAIAKVNNDANEFINATVKGYSSLGQVKKDIRNTKTGTEYALMPIWRYTYRYRNKNYQFYVNAQTGKVSGKVPLSARRIWAFTGITVVTTFAFLKVLQMFLEVL